MKNTLRLTLVLLLLAIGEAFAKDSFTANGFTFAVNNDKPIATLVSYQPDQMTDYSQPFHIPATVTHEGKTYAVERIDNEAFSCISQLQSVVVDEGIESMGRYVFAGCTNLRSIHLPASLESVCEGLFACCYSLTSVVVDAKNKELDSRDNCNAIISTDDDELVAACAATVIPSSVKTIGKSAFVRCTTLEHITIPEGVKEIGIDAFYLCSSLKTISLPESLVEIKGEAFRSCASLQSIFIPKSVENIWENCFAECHDLMSIVVDAANPYFDSRSNCNGIVRKADSALIASCRATTITDDISVLATDCFSGTIRHAVKIPASVTKIEDGAFHDCYQTETFIVDKDNPAYCSPEGINAILTKDGKTLVAGCLNTIIPAGVETIGAYAFAGRYSRPSLRIPSTVKRIEEGAFVGNTMLNEVIIPSSVEYIGDNAFARCTNLSIMHNLSRCNTIGANAYSHCMNR